VIAQECLSQVGSVLEAMDQPSVDGLNTCVVSEAVRGAGITVALSGLGSVEMKCSADTRTFVTPTRPTR
jgi:asparagine synthase (glutamine-hydrolysing)